MIDNTPRCRLCGNQLKAVDSCSVCGEIKKNLIWPVFTEADEYSAKSIISSTLGALKRRMTRLNTEVAKEKAGEYNTALTRDIALVGRTLKELAAEKRKLEAVEQDSFDQLGIEGKMEMLATEFFARLPADFQVKFLELVKAQYVEQNTPLLPESTDE